MVSKDPVNQYQSAIFDHQLQYILILIINYLWSINSPINYSLIHLSRGFPKPLLSVKAARSLTELFLDFADGTRLGDVGLKAEKAPVAPGSPQGAKNPMEDSWDFMDLMTSLDLIGFNDLYFMGFNGNSVGY